MVNVQESLVSFFSSFGELELRSAKEVLFEVYRETKMQKDWEVPVATTGIKVSMDGKEVKRIIVDEHSNFGLLHYARILQTKNNIELAAVLLDVAIAKMLSYGMINTMKMKKKITLDRYIQELNVSKDYEIEMPQKTEQIQLAYSYAKRDFEIEQEMINSPEQREDLAKEKNELYDWYKRKIHELEEKKKNGK